MNVNVNGARSDQSQLQFGVLGMQGRGENI